MAYALVQFGPDFPRPVIDEAPFGTRRLNGRDLGTWP